MEKHDASGGGTDPLAMLNGAQKDSEASKKRQLDLAEQHGDAPIEPAINLYE